MAKSNLTEENKSKRKGGTQFPKYSLSHLEPFFSELVSKTHSNAITIDQLNAGVFKVASSSTAGKIKCAALKQFGLIEGEYKALKATELASRIVYSTQDERTQALQESFLKIKTFKNAFETYRGSSADKQKIAGYAVRTLKIHPDSSVEFVKILSESAAIAGLCTVSGEDITFGAVFTPNANVADSQDEQTVEKDYGSTNDENDVSSTEPIAITPSAGVTHGMVATVNVNIDIDPSMDPEKLEKQLKLLRVYGVLK